jgi:Rrf2 family protein
MKISTKGRYALRLLLDLAVNENGKHIPIRDIATRQNISVKYLEQIVTQLNKAGYVNSTRGAQGGYVLAKPPEEYTVGMVLRLMEGELAPVSCLGSDDEHCERNDQCVTRYVWEKIQAAVESVVDHITLQDLVNDYREKMAENERTSSSH